MAATIGITSRCTSLRVNSTLKPADYLPRQLVVRGKPIGVCSRPAQSNHKLEVLRGWDSSTRQSQNRQVSRLLRFPKPSKLIGAVKALHCEQSETPTKMQLRLVLNFEGEKHELEYDTEDGRDVLAWQLFSLTGVGVQEQKIHGLFISDSSEDLSESVKDGFEFRLTRRNADPQVDGTATDTTSSPMLESDEELARRLQEEEDVQLARAMAQQLGAERSGGQNVEAFRGRLESGIQTVMQVGFDDQTSAPFEGVGVRCSFVPR